MSEPKLACAIWTWGTETKEQFTQAVKDVSEIGYKYFESVRIALNAFACNPDEQWSIAAEYGVEPTGFYFHLSDDPATDIADAKDKFKLLAKHDVKVITLQAMGIPGGRPDKEQLSSTFDTVTQFGLIGKEYGIRPCLHPHINTAVTFESEIDFMMQNTDPELVSMAPDTAHLKAAGCDPLTVMKRYADRIRFLHLKDLEDATASAAGYVAGVEIYSNFVELGTGDIDFTPIAQLLRNTGYSGFYTAELDMTRTSNKESARNNYNYMKRVFGGF